MGRDRRWTVRVFDPEKDRFRAYKLKGEGRTLYSHIAEDARAACG